MDVIGIGSAFVDYFIKTDEAFLKKLGLKPEDDFLFKEKKISKNDIFDKLKVLTKSPGGISVNTIAALAKLNIKVGYCGVIGKDINGDFWTKNIGNIDLSRIKRVGKTSICACLLTSQGKKRTFLSEVNPADFDFEPLAFSALRVDGGKNHSFLTTLILTPVSSVKAAAIPRTCFSNLPPARETLTNTSPGNSAFINAGFSISGASMDRIGFSGGCSGVNIINLRNSSIRT